MKDSTSQPGPFINIDQAAQLLHTSKNGIYMSVHRNQIPYYKRGRRLLFKRSELIKWVEESRQEPVSANN